METRNGITVILLLLCVAVCSVTADLYEYGPSNGDSKVTSVDDGYRQVNFTQGLPFYGYLFHKTYINENGLLSMITPVNEAGWKNVFPIAGDKDNNGDDVVDPTGADARILIAPFWTNVDITETTNVGSNIYYRQISAANDTTDTLSRATEEVRKCFLPQFDFTANHAVVVTWDDVSYFGRSVETGDGPLNKFQLVLVSDGRESFAFFIYDKLEWNAGTNDGATPEFGKSNRGATIGFNVGDPYKPFSHSRSAQGADSQAQLTTMQNCDSLDVGHWVYQIDQTEIVEAGCKNDADLTVFPSVGSMFGGEEIFLVGPCWNSDAEIKCKFTYNGDTIQEIDGRRIDNEKAVCIPEPFFLSGELDIEVSSDDGASYSLTQTYYVANLNRISSSGVTRLNTHYENWDKSGYDLELRWDAEVFDSNANLSITALAYREGSSGVEWVEVYDIDANAENDGEIEFEGTPVSKVNENNAFGAIRIRLSDDEDGISLWSDIHSFGYLLNQEYQDDRLEWSRTQCTQWAKADRKLDDFVDDLLPCPCTLQQAITDTGRFQPDTACSMFAGSVCTYHVGAKHCVRSVAATDDTSSGTQCCYNPGGDLMHAGDTDEGSTADRSHVWGAEPYQEANMVPGLSHWRHDVIPYHFCCLWGDDCKTYLDLRPTADCVEYQSPKPSAAFGDPHFVTFDGLNYTFNGMGEFTMVEESSSGFELQGRTELAKCKNCDALNITSDATVLTAVAMHEDDSDYLHVEVNAITVLKFIRKAAGSTEVVDFRGQEWLDFNGVSVIVVESDNGNIHKATVTFWNSGVGVNVTANGDMLAIAVTLPPSMEKSNKVKGLFGNWNGKTSDDLIRRSGSTLNPNTATDQQILEFGQSWEIETPLFSYEGRSHEDYQDNDFMPVFVAPAKDTLPADLVDDMDRVCGSSTQCAYDVSVTRDVTVGEFTIAALNMYQTTKEYTIPLAACPYLSTPINGTKSFKDENQQNYLEGAVVLFTCQEGLEVSGPSERSCQENSKWSGSGETECLAPGDIKKPSSNDSNVAGIVIGVLVAVVVLVVICVVIFMFLKKKKEESADPEAGEGAKKNKDYKDVKMSDVKEDDKDISVPPGEEDALNLEDATGAAKSEDD